MYQLITNEECKGHAITLYLAGLCSHLQLNHDMYSISTLQANISV
jgi:hypothetical protein